MVGTEVMLLNPRHKRRRKARINPRRVRRRRRTVAAANPRRRRRSVRRVARANPFRVRRRRSVRRVARRNPIGSATGFFHQDVIPAGVGALGAMGLDLAFGYLTPVLPVELTGMMMPVVRIAGAVGIGYAAKLATGNARYGDAAMLGAITVTLYDLFKGWLVTADPAIFGAPSSSQPQANAAIPTTTGLFVDGMGHILERKVHPHHSWHRKHFHEPPVSPPGGSSTDHSSVWQWLNSQHQIPPGGPMGYYSPATQVGLFVDGNG